MCVAFAMHQWGGYLQRVQEGVGLRKEVEGVDEDNWDAAGLEVTEPVQEVQDDHISGDERTGEHDIPIVVDCMGKRSKRLLLHQPGMASAGNGISGDWHQTCHLYQCSRTSWRGSVTLPAAITMHICSTIPFLLERLAMVKC